MVRRSKLRKMGAVTLVAGIAAGSARAGNEDASLPQRERVAMHDGRALLPFDATPTGMPIARYLAAREGRLQTGDLSEIQQHGRLRVLMLREQAGGLGSRHIALQRELITGFARNAGLMPEWFWVDRPRDLEAALRQGLGDVVIGDVPLNDGNAPDVARTVALKQVRYTVVTRSEDRHIDSKADLYGLRAGLSASSPLWPLLEDMTTGHPAILRIPTDGYPQADVFRQLAEGRFDFTVIPTEGSEDNAIDGQPDLRKALALTSSQSISWLVRASNPDLRKALNHHLNVNRLASRLHKTARDDLDRIQDRGVLKVITRLDTDNYFISRGERAGFEYDMIREFCLRKGLRIEVLVADSDEQMLAWLKEGVGDVVTARLDRRLIDADSAVAVTRMYRYVAPVLVAHTDRVTPSGGRVLVSKDGDPATWRSPELSDGSMGSRYQIVQTGAARSLLERIDAVAAGEADYTVVDADRLHVVDRYRDDMRAVTSISESHPYRFTLRADNPQLLNSLDEFLRTEYDSDFYRAAERRYFDNDDLFALTPQGFDDISPYDDLVKQYAERYAFDWRLIVAQMYEESRFKPNSVSRAGARGLMQVLPHTARSLGFRWLDEPEVGIHAGVKYLDAQRDRFEETLAVADRTWFALAAYHAGFDRVQAARRQARRMGLDADRWFDNVELAMVSISRDGRGNTYRGGRVTAAYVRDVRARYESYVQMQPARTVAML